MKFLEEIEEQEVTKLFESEDKMKETILETKSDHILMKIMLEALQNKIQKIHIAQTGK